MNGAGERPQTPAELKEQIEMERLGAPLLIYRDDDVQRIAQIEDDRGALWIGRSPSADVSLPGDSEVSKLHAQFRTASGARFEIADLGSRNHTRLNGQRLGTNAPQAVGSGDVIQFGDVVTQLVDAASLYDLLVQIQG